MPDETKVEAKVVEPVVVPVVAPAAEVIVDPLADKDKEIAALKEERDNYKTVALARKGKLPADSEVLGEDFDALIDAKVATALADKQLVQKEAERQAEIVRITKENSELRLALKNRPSTGLGSDSGGSQEVKDNVLSTAQIESLKAQAIKLKADPEKFIENYKKNLARK